MPVSETRSQRNSVYKLLSSLGAILYSLLTCRVIFNIRGTAQRGTLHATELHNTCEESELSLGLQFALPSPDVYYPDLTIERSTRVKYASGVYIDID